MFMKYYLSFVNTNTNLYDFYIKKKSNFFPGWIYSLLSFTNKHIYSMGVQFDFFQTECYCYA